MHTQQSFGNSGDESEDLGCWNEKANQLENCPRSSNRRGQKMWWNRPAIMRPDRICRCADQHSRISGKNQAGQGSGEFSGPPHSDRERVYIPAQDELISNQSDKHAAGKSNQSPHPDRHRRLDFYHPQHGQESLRPAQVGNQENWADRGSNDGDPQRSPGERRIFGEHLRGEGYHRRDAGNAANKKVEGDFPGPERGFQYRQAVVALSSANLRRVLYRLPTLTDRQRFIRCLPADFIQALFGGLAVYGGGLGHGFSSVKVQKPGRQSQRQQRQKSAPRSRRSSDTPTAPRGQVEDCNSPAHPESRRRREPRRRLFLEDRRAARPGTLARAAREHDCWPAAAAPRSRRTVSIASGMLLRMQESGQPFAGRNRTYT